MAIDERNVLAGRADAPPGASPRGDVVEATDEPEMSVPDDAEATPDDPTGDVTPTGTDRSQLGLDDLRLRLDSPLFARDPGLAAAAPVPHLRELTWEHVINPTSQQPIITPAMTPVPDIVPVSIEEILSRPSGRTPSIEGADAAPPAGDAPEPGKAPASRETAARDGERLVDTGAPWNVSVLPRSEPPPQLDDWADQSRSIDDVVLQISVPPPVARPPDPVVTGLAELIAGHTPAGGQPRVDRVRPGTVSFDDPADHDPADHDSADHDSAVSDSVPEPEPSVVPEPALDDAAPVGEQSVPTVEPAAPLPPPSTVTPPPPPPPVVAERVSGPHAAVDASAVEAELNRLAFLPDQDDDIGPVEVPRIVPSDDRGDTSMVAAVAAPMLSQAEMYTPRQAVPQHRGRTYTDLIVEAAPVKPRRKRHLFRKFLTMVVLLALVGGGLFAVKFYLLDRTHWAADVAPLAHEVEQARQLTFAHDVDVATVPASEYGVRLADSMLGLDNAGAQARTGEWRALGVLTGALDRRAIGLAALPDSPSFYDVHSGTIYVVDGLPDQFRRFALERSLALALLDQHFGWGARVTSASTSVATGTRAFYDGDALAIALSLVDTASRPKIIEQLFGVYSSFKIPTTPSPYASTVTGKLGVALWPFFADRTPAQRDAIETGAVFDDGQALDLRRLSADTAAAPVNGRGMLFWYHVLSARVDGDLAWRAALGWKGDTVSPAPGGGARCVSAAVRVADTSVMTAMDAFTKWAAAAPAASSTSVELGASADGVSTITVKGCDPGAAVATNAGAARLSLGGAPLRAEQFRILEASSKPALTDAQAACAVYGNDKVTLADERGIIDGARGWKAPSQHPKPKAGTAGCPAG